MTTAPDKTPDRIASMFDAIAPRYDLLNHLLSAGIDRRWRTKMIASLKLTGQETLIDVCTGTADVALAARLAAEPGSRGTAARVLGVDFAGAMLALGQQKVRDAGEQKHIALVRGDAMRIPAPDGVADAATVAFGVRNVQKADVACRELARVLRPGGRLAILEFSVPRVPGLASLYRWYFSRVLPRDRPDDLRAFRRIFVPSCLGRDVPSAQRIRDTPETFGLCGRPCRPADFWHRLSLCGDQRTADKRYSGTQLTAASGPKDVTETRPVECFNGCLSARPVDIISPGY